MEYTIKLRHRALDKVEFVRHYPSCSVTTNKRNAVVLDEIEALEAFTRLQKYNPHCNVTLETVK